MKLNSRMVAVQRLFLVVFNFLWIHTRGDTDVFCIFMESCTLPCIFQASDEVVIHWTNATAVNAEETVHSYYNDQDQLTHQDQRFRGRTSLSKQQISTGDASLLLTGVEVQDQGRYRCYTSSISGNKDSFINLIVNAPVRKVNIQQVENRITCSSDGIYPEPKISWGHHFPLVVSPSNISIEEKHGVQQSEQQLYNISSSLILSQSFTNLIHSCTVSTRTNRKTVTFRQLPPFNSSSSAETTIPCTASKTPLTGFSLVWRFNHSQNILTQGAADVTYTASEEWRQQVKSVSQSGGLTLQHLTPKHGGMYMCERSNAEETHVTTSFVRIEDSGSGSGSEVDLCVSGSDCETNDVTGITSGLVGAICVLVLIGLGVGLYCKKVRKDRQKNQTETRDAQRQAGDVSGSPDEVPLNVTVNVGG
ncbi:hypothetical protein PAMA_008320 [Pampus argenteus]